MKKGTKFLVLACGIYLAIALFFYAACSVIDRIFIEPSIEFAVKNSNVTYVNESFCSRPSLGDTLKLACDLSTMNVAGESAIRKTITAKYNFREKVVFEGLRPQGTQEESLGSKLLFVLFPRTYDVYMLQYSNRYSPKWKYRILNVFDNYANLTARLATAIATMRGKDDFVIYKNQEIIVLTDQEKSLLARRIYADIEEIYVFSN